MWPTALIGPISDHAEIQTKEESQRCVRSIACLGEKLGGEGGQMEEETANTTQRLKDQNNKNS
jgi:hypothetical protein